MGSTTFRDVLMLMLFGFMFMIIAMIPHLNPPAQEDESKPPGNVIANISWPPGNVDVDMWVMGPGEMVPVGYSNLSGYLWNLLRDDTGTGSDATPINYENAYTRGLPPGEYIVNVHCYRCGAEHLPIEVGIEVSVKKMNTFKGKDQIDRIVTTRVTIPENRLELTAIRFSLDADGDLVPGSLNHVFYPLRELRPPLATENEERTQ